MRGTGVWARLLGLQRVVVEGVQIGDEGEIVVVVRPGWRERDRCGRCRRRSPGFDQGGRAGGFRLPASTRQIRRTDPDSRLEFPSLMTSLNADLAAQALDSDALPESDCPCPSCQQASSTHERLAHADDHNLWSWMALRDDLAALDADQRLERYRFRLQSAAKELTAARKAVPALRSLRHIAIAHATVETVLRESILDTPARLRRAG